jgi:uncharacterized protein (TIGR02453 family)
MATAATTTQRFSGFPDGGIQFLLDLQAEQSRPWFKAHQADFERLWRKPLELYVTELQARLADVYPGITEVEPHFFRIQRDTRFARDKSPYKTNVAANWAIRPPVEAGPSPGNGPLAPGIYVSFGLEDDGLGMGAWHMAPELLQRYREKIAHPSSGAEISAIIEDFLNRGYELSSMEVLKRVPAPYPQDHPNADLLKRKGLAVWTQIPDDLCASPALLDWSEQELRRMKPLVAWLDKHLT